MLPDEPAAAVGAVPLSAEAHRLDVLERDLLDVVQVDGIVDMAVAVQLVEAHGPATVKLPRIGSALAELEAIHLLPSIDRWLCLRVRLALRLSPRLPRTPAGSDR